VQLCASKGPTQKRGSGGIWKRRPAKVLLRRHLIGLLIKYGLSIVLSDINLHSDVLSPNQITDLRVKENISSLSEIISKINQKESSVDEGLPVPKTTLEIQEELTSESAWQKYLRYFLDPTEKHRLDDTFATALINLLQQSNIVDPNLEINWNSVVLRTEPPADTSRPDLLMYEPGKWFTCFELKINSDERPGQTVNHVLSQYLGKLNKSDIPAEHHYYLYVAPPWAGSGEADLFEAVPWDAYDREATVKGAISEVLKNPDEDIPQRTVTQIKEFRDTIDSVTNMSDIDEQTRNLTKLYIENKESVDQVLEAKENYAEWFFDTRVPFALNEEYSPAYWGNDWKYDSYKGYTKLYRNTWQPGNDIDVHLEYYPKAEKLFGGKIHIRFDIEFDGEKWEATDGRRPQQVFADELISILDKDSLPNEAQIREKESSKIHKFSDIKYQFDMESEEDYLQELQDGLNDMAPLVSAVDDVIDRWDSIVKESRG